MRQAGARIRLIRDGDVAGVIATARPDSGIDIYMGIGGAPEGVLAAAALRSIGGQMQGKLHFRNDDEKARAQRMGITDLERVYDLHDLAAGDVMFAATGVTDGTMLRGVRRFRRRRHHPFDHDALQDRHRAPDRDRALHRPQARGRAGVRHLSAYARPRRRRRSSAPSAAAAGAGASTIPATALAICQRLDLPEVIGRVLAGRGVALDGVPAFIAPRLRDALPDPSHLLDLDLAVERLADAVQAEERVGLLGDYDVDGATSVALLARYLAAVGAPTAIDVPDRLREGYGPNAQALERLAAKGCRLVVTLGLPAPPRSSRSRAPPRGASRSS